MFQCKCPSDCYCTSTIYALITLLQIKDRFETLVKGIYVPNTASYVTTNEDIVVSHVKLKGVCIKMLFDDTLYISKPCHSMDREKIALTMIQVSQVL